jgi:hypothetical protein
MTRKELRFQIALWMAARSLPFRLHGRPLSDILESARARRSSIYRGLSSAYIVKSIVRMVRHPWIMRNRRCFREGLLAFQFLEAAGFTPALHFGIDRNSLNRTDVQAHCWVVCDGEVILNAPTADMVPILVWPAAGRAVELPDDLARAKFD